jgi:hypothetical protein
MDCNKPFNDVVDHATKIEGGVGDLSNSKRLPKPLRYFGYFVAGFFTVSILFMIIINVIDFFQ